jgi:hypothetical protein
MQSDTAHDELVEQMARAMYEVPTFGASGAGWEPWVDAPHEVREHYRHEARAALSVARQSIRKQALEDAAKLVDATPYQFKITGAPPDSIEVIDTSKTIAAAIRAME